MMNNEMIGKFGRRVRLGMVGGGAGSLIGETHMLALRADGLCELVAGALSSRPHVARASGARHMIPPDRIYTDFRSMAQQEALRPDPIDAVVIATPPDSHLPIATVFLESGIDVVCEKPITKDIAEAKDLVRLVSRSGRLFCLTHCYTGYPMVRQARFMVTSGAIGRVRIIEVEFSSGDPGTALEPDDPSKRHWRFKTGSMGKAAILGEVGSHAYHIATYVSGLRAERVSATMTTLAARREVYDNAYLTVEFARGAVGRLWNSYVAVGHDHGLRVRIFGETGNLAWEQENPEYLTHKQIGGPPIVLARGYSSLGHAALRATRFRAGFPEGYGLAFANLYADFAQALIARKLGLPYAEYLEEVPTVDDGLEGMRMIEAAVRSHERGGSWVSL